MGGVKLVGIREGAGTPLVAILIPVLNRPHRIAPLLASIAEATPEPHTIRFAVSAEDRETLTALADNLEPHIRVNMDRGDTWPNRINRLFWWSEEPHVFLAADDLLFHPGWLSAAMAAMREVDGVVVVNDLHNPNGTLALVSRRYIEEESGCIDTPNVVIYPGYGHNYADDELFATARRRNRYAYCPQAVVEHLHPAAGKAEMDATYDKGLETLEADIALHEERKRLWGAR